MPIKRKRTQSRKRKSPPNKSISHKRSQSTSKKSAPTNLITRKRAQSRRRKSLPTNSINGKCTQSTRPESEIIPSDADSLTSITAPGNDPQSIYCDGGQALLSWNIRPFQILLNRRYWFDNATMNTFLRATRHEYRDKDHKFAFDEFELFPVNEFDLALKDSTLMANRKQRYASERHVCRILVTGDDNNHAHYQVLILHREHKVIELIEFANQSTVSNEQKVEIRKVLYSLGWEEKQSACLISRGCRTRGNWLLKHKTSHQNDQASCLGPDCGPFACIVFHLCVSNGLDNFRFDDLEFVSDSSSSSGMKVSLESLRMQFLLLFHKVLRDYVSHKFIKMKNTCSQSDWRNESDMMRRTHELLSLDKDKFKEAIVSGLPDGDTKE